MRIFAVLFANIREQFKSEYSLNFFTNICERNVFTLLVLKRKNIRISIPDLMYRASSPLSPVDIPGGRKERKKNEKFYV